MLKDKAKREEAINKWVQPDLPIDHGGPASRTKASRKCWLARGGRQRRRPVAHYIRVETQVAEADEALKNAKAAVQVRPLCLGRILSR